MTIWDAILQGLIQGLTEFLPVSSSGHVSLVQHFTGTNIEGAQSFTLFLHFGTLIAVFIAYWSIIKDLVIEALKMLGELFGDLFRWIKVSINNLSKYGSKVFKKGVGDKGEYIFDWKLKNMSELRRMVIMVIIACFCAILLFVPVFGGLGLAGSDGEEVETLADVSEYTSEDADIMVEGICLLVTGGLLISATQIAKKRREQGEYGGEVGVKTAVIMGIGQCLAAMPGLSRSGTTTTLGMISGTEKNRALQFSFIIGIPAVLASNVLELFGMESADWQAIGVVPTIVGIIVSGVVGVVAIVGLKWIVKNNKLHYFGWYCLAAGTLVIVASIVEKSMGLSGQELIALVFGGAK